MNRKFLIDNVVSSSSNVLVGIVNWLFTYILLKYSGIDVSNSFLTLMSFFLIVTIPATTNGYIVNKIGPRVLDIFHKHVKVSSVLILVYLLFVAFFSLWNGYGLKTISIIYLFILVSILSNYYKSLLQHYLLFLQYSSISLIEVVIKLIVLLFFLRFTENAPLIALFVQLIIGLILSWYFYNRSKIVEEMTSNLDMGILLTVTLFTASMVVYSSIDTVIGKFSLSGIDLNIYQKLLQISKILIFFCVGLNTVLIPTLEKQLSETKNFKLILYITLAEILATIGFVAVILLFRNQLFTFFGIESINILPVVAFIISGGIYAISQTFSVMTFRQNKWRTIFTIFVITTILQIILFTNSHNIHQFIVSTLIISFVNLGLYLAFQYSHIKLFYLDYINDAKEVV